MTQGLLALSSGEAELYAVGYGVMETVFLRGFLREVNLAPKVTIAIYTDPAAGTSMATRYGASRRTRRIELRSFYTQSLVAVGFVTWMTKHHGGIFLNYGHSMPTPHAHYVDEDAQAEGRAQWPPQGLNTLATELIHFPMDDDCMGCEVQAQPFVLVEELPQALRANYLEFVSEYYDMCFVLPTMPAYYKFVVIADLMTWTSQINLQRALLHRATLDTTMGGAAYISKLLRPLCENYT